MSEVQFTESEGRITLANERVRVEVRGDGGSFDIVDAASGRRFVTGAKVAVTLAGGSTGRSHGGFAVQGTSEAVDGQGKGLTVILSCAGTEGFRLGLKITLYEEHLFVALQAEVVNTGMGPLRVHAFHVLDGGTVDLGGPVAGWRIYKEGWQNWTPAAVLPCSGEDLYWAPPVIGPTTQPPRQAGRFVAEMMATIKDGGSGNGITAGFISTAEQFSQVWLDRDTASLTAVSYADGIEVAPGAALSSERLLVESSASPLASMERYGDALAREMQAVPWPHVTSGWCSWYYYWQGVTEEAVLANMAFLSWHRKGLPVEYVQIDDGYQAGIGDWLTPNEKFPRGMKWIASQIHGRGYKAGIWLAPFMIGAGSQLYREHPDWAVQYQPGRPYIAMVNWAQECYAMDLTRPDVMEWLETIFRTVFDEWGYDYVKIDFLYAGAVDGIRHDPNVTRAQAYRRAIELIRRIAGGRFILGCGNPMAPSIGLVNGTRIGPDVAPYWYPAEPPREEGRNDLSLVSTLNGIRNVMGRFWMHNRLWLNDPDCMIARDSETALKAGEVRTLAAIIALSGGMVLDSDNLMRLSDERRAMVSMMLPPYGKSGVPLDLFESSLPRLFDLDCETHHVLGVFNWADEPAEVSAPLPDERTHVFDVWDRDYLGALAGSVSFKLPPHGCRLLALRPASETPQVVGSTFHLLQGAVEIVAARWDGETLSLSLRPVAVREGQLYLRVPEEWSTPTVEGVADVEVGHAGNGLLVLSMAVDEPCELRLAFSRR